MISTRSTGLGQSSFRPSGTEVSFFSSPNGLTWTKESVPTGLSLRGVTQFGDDQFVVGPNDTIIRGSCEWPTDPPVAKFAVSENPTSPEKPIQFTNMATGYIQTWHWEFGDGGQSSASDPLHRYAAPGEYTAYQTVCNDGGCEKAKAVVTVELAPPRARISWMGPQIESGRPTLWRDLSSGPPIPGRGFSETAH